MSTNPQRQTGRSLPVSAPALAAAAAALAAAALLALCGPLLLWAYHIQRAGSLLETGLRWPAPRQSDSLPQTGDPDALAAAQEHLLAAQRWRPQDSYAHRLAGQAAMARADWATAAAEFEQARALAPADPLPAWEAGLAYEQMIALIDRAPYRPVLDTLAAGQVEAPPVLVRSLFCNSSGAASCYAGRTSFSLPFADSPNPQPVRLPGLFLHPPARITQQVSVPTDTTALQFVLGLDPAAREWRTDGATFRVYITPPGGAALLRYERALDRAAALRGWVFGWADLTPWAGQTVAVTLESDPGPRGDSADDWYAWADPAFTSVQAAEAVDREPRRRRRAAWQAAGLTVHQMRARAEEARARQDSAAAERWAARAGVLK